MENESANNGCPFLSGCPVFNVNMRAFPVGAEVMNDQYCRGEYARCARYLIATQLGREKMPSMLFPNQMDRAQKVLAEHGITDIPDPAVNPVCDCDANGC